MPTRSRKNTRAGAAKSSGARPAASAVNKALHQFLRAPSVSNKVATLVALQALFAEVDDRH